MTEPKPLPNPSETKLVERLNEDAEWNWISEDNAGFSAELISNLQHTATLEREAATALASLADELRLARERVAELEKAVVGECEECGQTIITPLHHLPSVEKDAARYRKLKAAIAVPYAMQSFIKHMNWHPDTFKMGIDEAIDAAMKEPR